MKAIIVEIIPLGIFKIISNNHDIAFTLLQIKAGQRAEYGYLTSGVRLLTSFSNTSEQ